MKFLVIGDLMIDRYLMGKMTRISAEAPVPIVDVVVQYDVLGGAANCARNLSTLTGPNIVDIAGYVGEDNDGSIILDLLHKNGINFLGWETSIKPTILKERIFAGNQQVLRMDIEEKEELMFDEALFSSFNYDSYDYIIVSDYAKGTVTRKMMDYLAPYAFKMIIDPKPENWSHYPPGVLLVTPNEFEHSKMLYRQPELPQHILVTKGKNGMTLHTDQWSKDIKTKDVENCEVMGAGDTVSATMAYTLALTGYNMVDCATIANECARYVVSQPGTAVVPQNVYQNILSSFNGEDL